MTEEIIIVDDGTAVAERIRELIAEAVADGRKLVTVRTIDAINDIPGADLIKVAQIEGWQVVVKAGEFNVGDPCVFFEVDAFLQLSDTRFAFLEKNAITWHGIRGARLKTIRLRKQLSQGLALPLKDFPEIIAEWDRLCNEPGVKAANTTIRDVNFTGVVGVMKWEKIMSAQLAGQARGNFPSFIQKSDQERAQNMGDRIFSYDEQLRPVDISGISMEQLTLAFDAKRIIEKNGQYFTVVPPRASRETRYDITIKLDGSSMTLYCRLPDSEGDMLIKDADGNVIGNGVQSGVCSRNLDLKIEGNEGNSFVDMAQSGMLDQLVEYCKRTGRSLALQGELMGPGIQGNREGLTENKFFLYNIFNINTGVYLAPEERYKVLAEINSLADEGIDPRFKYIAHVPVLFPTERFGDNGMSLAELGITDMASLLKFAEGKSLHNAVREGLVFKAYDGTHQFKVISNLYLEQEK